MGKGAQFEGGRGATPADPSSARVTTSTSYDHTKTPAPPKRGARGSPPLRGDDEDEEDPLGLATATTTRSGALGRAAFASPSRGLDDARHDEYDVRLVDGRTGGGLPASGPEMDRAALAERRLLETQQVLVQERLSREVAEAILAETAKALSAVRRAAADGGIVGTTDGVPLRGGGEEANARLHEKLRMLRDDYERLRVDASAKDAQLERSKLEVARLEDATWRAEGGKPVTINMHLREMTTADQDELVMASKALLNRATALEASVAELREVDERKTRAMAELMGTLEGHNRELKEKLKDAGLLDDDEYDDAKVAERAFREEAMGHMREVDVKYSGPATSPLGKCFYVTRTATAWDWWFGVHC